MLDKKVTPLGSLHKSGPPRVASLSSPVQIQASKVYGLRRIYRLTMGLQTIPRMGPVRRALAQRVVSGGIEVRAPWADAVARGDADPGELKR